MNDMLLSIIGGAEEEAFSFSRLGEQFLKLFSKYHSLGDVFDAIGGYLGKSFAQKALIVGVLIALCAAMLGVSLVLKRFSFIGDGLSHVAFGAMAVASVLGLTQQKMVLILPVTVFTAVLLLKTGKNRKVRGDASLAMLSVGALGVGYILMNVFSTGNVSSDVCTSLFGSTAILSISDFELYLCIGMTILVLAVYILFYHKIFAVTFDPDFASATGTKSEFYNLVTAVVTAIVIVLAMNLVGSLLISALVVFPVLSAMRLCRSFKGVVICSAAVSVGSTAFGIFSAMLISTPVGSTIVVAQIFVFLVFTLIGIFTKKG